MKRVVSALTATLAAVIILPAVASATDIQVGVTKTPLTSPVCPAGSTGKGCTIVLDQVTAYETVRDGVRNPTAIKQAGVVASFSIALASNTILSKYVAAENAKYGGPPEVQLTVLRPTGTIQSPTYRVAAQSAVYNVQSQFGTVAEIPLISPLPVVPGEILALTIPTWAPVLSFDLSTSAFSYRQSRKEQRSVVKGKVVNSCDTVGGTNLAQALIGQLSSYSCNYPGNRVEYSALEITTPAGLTGAVLRRQAALRAAKR
jgi:hypothetical protein